MSGNYQLWSQTASSNDVADASVNWAEGMSPGAVNNSARALMAAVASNRDDNNGSITTGGSANNYTFTSAQTIATYLNNVRISVKASFTNTGAANLNLNTIGLKAIKVFDTGAEGDPAPGQIVANGRYDLEYDTAANSAAGAWILLNPTPDPTSQVGVGDIKIWATDTLPTGYLWCNGAAVSRSTYATLLNKIGTTYGTGDGTTTFNVPDMCGRAPFGSDDMGGISAKGRVTSAVSGIDGTALGASGGSESVTLDGTTLPNHTHTGTSDAGGVDHNHSGTTALQGTSHTHNYIGPVSKVGTFTGPGSNGWGGGDQTLTTTGDSAFHQHSFTSGGASAVNHTHTFTTAATGTGAAHRNLTPLIILNYIIKTG